MAELWIVTSFFNPSCYRTKRRNYDAFISALDVSGVPCLTVECAFGDAPFELTPSERVLHVRSNDVLWQKERLLNVAIRTLPNECTKVAWLDCDVLFDSPAWAAEVTVLLDRYFVVQPFAMVVRLPRDTLHDDGRGRRWPSFASVYERDPLLAASGTFDPHGHTGFAWAARRDVLQELGLYDVCIAGSADHLMAHVFAGSFDNECVRRIVGAVGPYRAHFLRWARRMNARVRGRLASGTGALRHLWHGDEVHRHYVARNDQLVLSSFHPDRDIALSSTSCWEWRPHATRLRAWMIDYFASRREDGDDPQQ